MTAENVGAVQEVPAYQAIDILLRSPETDLVSPVRGFVLHNASPIFEGGTKCVVLNSNEEELHRIKSETDHLSKWPSSIIRCWIHIAGDGRQHWTVR